MMVKDFERSERYGRRWNSPKEDRHCLKCRRPFKSWGKQNRICEGVGIVHQGDGSMQTAINAGRCPKCKSTMTASACDVCGLIIGGDHGRC